VRCLFLACTAMLVEAAWEIETMYHAVHPTRYISDVVRHLGGKQLLGKLIMFAVWSIAGC